MRRGVLADFAANRCTNLGTVAPVHPAPNTRVALLGMDLVHARVGTNNSANALETRSGQNVHRAGQAADVRGPQSACRWRPEKRSRRLLSGSARRVDPTNVLDLVVVDRVGPAVERWRCIGTEARRVVIAERRDELKKWSLRVRRSAWGWDPHTGTATGSVAHEFQIVAMISDARLEHLIGSGLAHRNAINDCFR